MKSADLAANRIRSRALPMFGEEAIPPERDLQSKTTTAASLVFCYFCSGPSHTSGHKSWVTGGPVITGLRIGSRILSVVGAITSVTLRFWLPPSHSQGLCWEFCRCPWPGQQPPVLADHRDGALHVCYGVLGRSGADVGDHRLVLSGIGTNVAAAYVIEGRDDSVYAAAITIACIIGWKIQYKLQDGSLHLRYRTGTHLVYFYAVNFGQWFIGLSLALILADLLTYNKASRIRFVDSIRRCSRGRRSGSNAWPVRCCNP